MTNRTRIDIAIGPRGSHKRRSVLAHVYGIWAVHGEKGSGGWASFTVTHVPTGMALHSGFASEPLAHAFAKRLSEMSLPITSDGDETCALLKKSGALDLLQLARTPLPYGKARRKGSLQEQAQAHGKAMAKAVAGWEPTGRATRARRTKAAPEPAPVRRPAPRPRKAEASGGGRSQGGRSSAQLRKEISRVRAKLRRLEGVLCERQYNPGRGDCLRW